MKIAQVVCVYPPYKGGIGNVAKEYAERLQDRGHDVQVFSLKKPSIFFGNASFMPSLLWRLRGFDIVHLHYPFYGAAFFAALASVVWRIPMVTTYHMKTRASGLKGLLFLIHRVFLEPFILGDTSAILVSSRDYARTIGLHAYSTVAQPFGVDTQRFTPGTNVRLRAALNIAENSCVFLFVGGLDAAHYFKGIPALLQAAQALLKDAAWNVVIIGGGDQKARYEHLAQTLGVEDRVHFVGHVSDEDLPAYYRLADVHVLPSINGSEAYGLVTLEAAASGLPSLVSDLPGVRTLVRVEQTGLIVTPGDVASLTSGMQRLINDPETRSAWGAAARDMVVTQYDTTEVIDQLISVYKTVTVAESL